MAKQRGTGGLGSRRELFLLVLAAIFLVGTLLAFVLTQRWAENDREYLNLARNTQQQAQELGRIGDNAARGITPDFRLIGGAQENIDENILFLKTGDDLINLPAAPAPVQEKLADLEIAWADMSEAVSAIQEGRGNYLTAEQLVFQIRDAVPDLSDSLSGIGARLVDLNAPTEQIFLVADQRVKLEQIRSRADRVLGAGRNADLTVEQLAADVGEFRSAIAQLKNSRTARDASITSSIEGIERSLRTVAQGVEGLDAIASDIAEIQESSSILSQLGTEVLAWAIEVEDALSEYAKARPIKDFYIYIFGGLSALFLLLFVAFFLFNVRRRQLTAERSEKLQQEAILKMLDEITNLADGDLTTSVTVTEDFTGAIADSINFTIDTLRTLVGTINSTAQQVATAASGTLDTATGLNQASQEQTEQISSAAQTVGTMTQQMQAMSSEAESLARQAQTSLETARSGGETVRRTIQGMDALREQIQDTSKRIKRLGESSQEIGNIIEFINDIAEQTNTLALNASIQAAMAGESGKGFAVVADEVQRLAERAGTATKQIEALVKTIQADTNEAIISMERSTTNVVSGAKSAEEAGTALERIENFASELARLIQTISGTAREQASMASGVSDTMLNVQNIAAQTASAANLTATSTRDLTTLSEQLRESVSGFRLPEDMLQDLYGENVAAHETREAEAA